MGYITEFAKAKNKPTTPTSEVHSAMKQEVQYSTRTAYHNTLFHFGPFSQILLFVFYFLVHCIHQFLMTLCFLIMTFYADSTTREKITRPI
jgi:hypothetical protein